MRKVAAATLFGLLVFGCGTTTVLPVPSLGVAAPPSRLASAPVGTPPPTPSPPTVTPTPTASPSATLVAAPTKAPAIVVTDAVLVSFEDQIFRGVAGEYHWTDLDVGETRFRVRWSVYAPADRSCKFNAWFDSHPETRFTAAPKSGKRANEDKGVSATTQGGLTVRTTCAKWILRIVAPTYDNNNNNYWYCWDSGPPRPHHLGYPVNNDHWCTDEELRQSGT